MSDNGKPAAVQRVHVISCGKCKKELSVLESLHGPKGRDDFKREIEDHDETCSGKVEYRVETQRLAFG